MGVFLRTMLEKATACKYSSRSMSKEKKKSSLIDDPTSCRCRRRLGTYGSHFAGFLVSVCYHFPHCHNMSHIANIVYLENHIIRFICHMESSPSFIQRIPTSYYTFTVWKLGTLASWVTSYKPKMTHHICNLTFSHAQKTIRTSLPGLGLFIDQRDACTA